MEGFYSCFGEAGLKKKGKTDEEQYKFNAAGVFSLFVDKICNQISVQIRVKVSEGQNQYWEAVINSKQ